MKPVASFDSATGFRREVDAGADEPTAAVDMAGAAAFVDFVTVLERVADDVAEDGDGDDAGFAVVLEVNTSNSEGCVTKHDTA